MSDDLFNISGHGIEIELIEDQTDSGYIDWMFPFRVTRPCDQSDDPSIRLGAMVVIALQQSSHFSFGNPKAHVGNFLF